MDWLAEGLKVTILGFSTVFVVLIFISLILTIFGAITNKALKNASVETEKNVKPIQTASKSAEKDLKDDLELVAVITAAIAASERAKGNDVSPDKLVVRSLRRVHTWNKEAMYEQLNTLF